MVTINEVVDFINSLYTHQDSFRVIESLVKNKRNASDAQERLDAHKSEIRLLVREYGSPLNVVELVKAHFDVETFKLRGYPVIQPFDCPSYMSGRMIQCIKEVRERGLGDGSLADAKREVEAAVIEYADTLRRNS